MSLEGHVKNLAGFLKSTIVESFAGWVNPCCHYSEHTQKYCSPDISLKKIHGHFKQTLHGVFKKSVYHAHCTLMIKGQK